MTERMRSLIFDGLHYRITLPIEFIKEKGWKKGDKISIKDENGHLVVNNATRKKSSPIVFSIGYEGKSLLLFIETLLKNNINQVIDIRENPISRKPGFSKRTLKKALKEVGISYKNIRELGTDKRSRDKYKKTGKIEDLLRIYEKRLIKKEDYYDILKALINFRLSAIMCFEDDYRKCHRQKVEDKLIDDGIRVKHICNGKQRRC
jgi:uncharacterized protein (DUF488 family)